MTVDIIFKKLLIDSNYFSNVFGNLKHTDFENDYVQLYNGIQNLYSKYNKSPNLNELNLYFDSLNLTTQQKLRINERIDELKHLEIDIKDEMLVDFTEKWVKNKRTNDLLLLGADFLDGKNKESLESIQVKMEEINKLTFKKSSGLDYKKDAVKNFLEYSTQNENGITPSLEIMRIATNGGYLPGHLIIYASVSNGGKTVFLVNGACDVLLQGKNVAYFTFEEMEIDIRERFDARLMNIQTNQFQKLGSSLISNFTSLLSKGLGELKIKAYGPRSASVLTVKSQLEEWKLKENFIPDMVVLDSIGIMAPSNKSDSLYMNGKNVSEEAKALGVELGVPLLSAVQFGRSSFGSNSPDMSDVAESIAIAQVASTMIGIIVDEQRPDIRTLSIIKSRKVNKSKIKAQNVHINTDLQKVWDFEGEKRVYLKQEQKEDLTLLNNIVEASEKVDEKTDFNSGTNLLEQLLRK